MTKRELDRLVSDNKELFEAHNLVQNKLLSIQA